MWNGHAGLSRNASRPQDVRGAGGGGGKGAGKKVYDYLLFCQGLGELSTFGFLYP